MARQWLRRALLGAAAASALVLAACGGGEIESQLQPTRVIAFGDATADVGQTSSSAATAARFTINDSTVNVWAQQVAWRFGVDLTPAVAGGNGYATGNARVALKPDAAGNAATPTVAEQIDVFLATKSFTANDLVLVGAGTSDVIANASAYIAGTLTSDQMLANVGQAGRDLGAQVRRLVNSGARQVAVVGPYNLSKSPWALQTNQGTALGNATAKFNEEFLVSVVDLGANVLYVDAAFYFNLVTAVPSAYGYDNGTTPACTSVDPGAGIGTGTGQVSSKLCTNSTLVSGINPLLYLFADRVYMTPTANRAFGDWAYEKIHERW